MCCRSKVANISGALLRMPFSGLWPRFCGWHRGSMVVDSTLRILLVGVVLVIVLAFSSMLFIRHHESRRQVEHVGELLSTVESTVRIACFTRDHVLAAEVARGLMTNHSVAGVRILSGAQVLAAERRPGNVDDAAQLGNIVRRRVVSPFAPEQVVGEIELVPDRGFIRSQAASYSSLSVIVLLLDTLAVAFAVAFVTMRTVVRPIRIFSDRSSAIRIDSGEHVLPPEGCEHNEIGQLAGVFNGMIDRMAHLLAAEQEMRERIAANERGFRTLAENSPSLIVRYDRDCRRVFINPAYQQQTGGSMEEARNKTPHEHWHSLTPPADYMARLSHTLESGEDSEILLEWRLESGGVVSHDMRLVAEYDGQGRVSGVLAVGHDITELKAVQQRLEKSRAQLRALTAKREEAREEERKRIALEIHDELGQLLSVLRLNITMLGYRFGQDNADLHGDVQAMVSTMDRAIAVVRNLAAELRPAALSAGIVPALEWLVQEFSRSTGIACELQVASDELLLGESKALAVFRVVQESLTNVLRHSGASHVQIRLRRDAAFYEAEVRDNGNGFDPQSADRGETVGLLGMRERALMLGGDLEIDSAPGKGALLRLRIPAEDGPGAMP